MLTKIDHIGIAVYNLGESLVKYRTLFNVEAKYIEALEDLAIRIAFIPVGEVMLELIEPLVQGKGSVADFLDRHGEGFHHVAYRVDDLKALLANMKKTGVALKDSTPRSGGAGSWIAFLKPEETNGALTELVEREADL
jgi:methylmalonyl-CoA/ethylmalonyl-CoA epimerase